MCSRVPAKTVRELRLKFICMLVVEAEQLTVAIVSAGREGPRESLSKRKHAALLVRLQIDLGVLPHGLSPRMHRLPSSDGARVRGLLTLQERLYERVVGISVMSDTDATRPIRGELSVAPEE